MICEAVGWLRERRGERYGKTPTDRVRKRGQDDGARRDERILLSPTSAYSATNALAEVVPLALLARRVDLVDQGLRSGGREPRLLVEQCKDTEGLLQDHRQQRAVVLV